MLHFIRLDALKRPDVDFVRKAEVETKANCFEVFKTNRTILWGQSNSCRLNKGIVEPDSRTDTFPSEEAHKNYE